MRMAVRMDREWRRVLMMVIAVLLAIGAVVLVASLGPDSKDTQLRQGGTKGATGTAPVGRVGGNGKFQYKVLP
jgi:hypothetical protein